MTASFLLIIGGIYAGIFTPTEAAGVGCLGVLVAAALRRKLSRAGIVAALKSTALISAMIFAIIVGGYLVARFLAVTGVTDYLVAAIIDAQLGRIVFLLLLIALYFVLGADVLRPDSRALHTES